jgi:crossover junction endodeoxyribonuclease RuvC
MPGDSAATTEPLVLGIDPGLRVCGWGVVRGGSRPEFVACGSIKPHPRDSFARRLLFLHGGLERLVANFRPDEVAIEDPFVGALQPASALAIGQARAAAVIAAAQAGLDVEFYAPAAVKSAVSGYGQGDKRQVQAMVRMLLSLEVPPEPVDAADALAVAICHLSHRKSRALAAAGGKAFRPGSRKVLRQTSRRAGEQSSAG